MSVRLPLLLATALTLAGCNFSKAPEEQAACDCKPAAGTATTAAVTGSATGGAVASKGETASASTSSATVTRVVHRTRPAVRRERSERRYYASERSDEVLAGGDYGRRYAGGASVSVTESETSSERYRYSESTERYGSRGGAAYGGGSSGYAYGAASSSSSGSAYGSESGGGYAQGYVRDDRYGARGEGRPPRGRPYHLAGKDRDGYLTWPGKVED